MATITVVKPENMAPARHWLTANDFLFGFNWWEAGKRHRYTNIQALDFAAALKITPDQLQAALGEIIAKRAANGTAANGRERTPAQQQREKDYRLARKAAMTDEQRELERTKRQAYNAVKNAEIKQALALLREQSGTK